MMKKVVLISYSLLLIIFITGCLTFSVIKGEQGKYQTIEMDKNFLTEAEGTMGYMQFNIKKTYSVSKAVFSVIISYEYPGEAFVLTDPKGVIVTLNNKYKFYLKTRIKPVDSSQLETNGGKLGKDDLPGTFYERLNKGLGMSTTKILAEYFLTPKQLKWLMQANDIRITMVNKNRIEGVPKAQIFMFKQENIQNIRKFYSQNR